jgi:hypothetical protein
MGQCKLHVIMKCINFLWLGIISLWIGWMHRAKVPRDVQLGTAPVFLNDSSLNVSDLPNTWILDTTMIWNFDYFLAGLPCNYWFPTCGGCVIYYPNSNPFMVNNDLVQLTISDSLVNQNGNSDTLVMDTSMDSTGKLSFDSTVLTISRWDKWKEGWRRMWKRKREGKNLSGSSGNPNVFESF